MDTLLSPNNSIVRLLALILPSLMLCIAGCGGTKIVKVKGALQVKGQALTASASTIVTLQFIPKEGGDTFGAKLAADKSSYEVEVPKGTYNINFIMHDMQSGKPMPKLKTLKADLEINENQTLDLETGS